jgi:hypothetical protein
VNECVCWFDVDEGNNEGVGDDVLDMEKIVTPPVSKRVGWADPRLGAVIHPLHQYQVAIHVSSWSCPFSSWRGFIGSITQSKVDKFCVGDLVLGVVLDASMSNHIVCHAG